MMTVVGRTCHAKDSEQQCNLAEILGQLDVVRDMCDKQERIIGEHKQDGGGGQLKKLTNLLGRGAWFSKMNICIISSESSYVPSTSMLSACQRDDQHVVKLARPTAIAAQRSSLSNGPSSLASTKFIYVIPPPYPACVNQTCLPNRNHHSSIQLPDHSGSSAQCQVLLVTVAACAGVSLEAVKICNGGWKVSKRRLVSHRQRRWREQTTSLKSETEGGWELEESKVAHTL
jgi:hypothetical protein